MCINVRMCMNVQLRSGFVIKVSKRVDRDLDERALLKRKRVATQEASADPGILYDRNWALDSGYSSG